MTDETIPLWEAIDLVRHERRLTSRAAFEWVRSQIERGELEIVAMMGPGDRADPNLYSSEQVREMWKYSSSMIEYDSRASFLWSLVHLEHFKSILFGADKKTGRPQEYPWNTMVAEVAMEFKDEDSLKSEAYVAKLQEVAKKLTGNSPGISTARPYARAIIEAKRRLAEK